MPSNKIKRKNPINFPRKISNITDPNTITCYDYFRNYYAKVEGLRYGVELEVEGARLPSSSLLAKENTTWLHERDSSLRSPDGLDAGGVEYITSSPLNYEDTVASLETLGGCFKIARATSISSPRTSTHIHVNIQDFTLSQLISTLIVYYSIEPMLCRLHGKHREVNHFCLQIKDTPSLLVQIKEMLFTRRFSDSDIKYSALNLMNICRGFGTLEFRAGAGIEKSPVDVIPWLSLVNELMVGCLKLTSPVDVLQGFSSFGAKTFYSERFPLIYAAIRPQFSSDEAFEKAVTRNYREVQELAYEVEWEAVEGVVEEDFERVVEENFGRVVAPTRNYRRAQEPRANSLHVPGLGLDLNRATTPVLSVDYPEENNNN